MHLYNSGHNSLNVMYLRRRTTFIFKYVIKYSIHDQRSIYFV